MQKMTPCLWFDDNAEEAVKFFTTSLFRNSKILQHLARRRSGNPAPLEDRKANHDHHFSTDGQDFMALNGGPHFRFTPAISLMVNCATRRKSSEYWDKLAAGGETQPCGWLMIGSAFPGRALPTALAQMMQDDQTEKSERVMEAILEMAKLDLPTLEKAYAGK